MSSRNRRGIPGRPRAAGSLGGSARKIVPLGKLSPLARRLRRAGKRIVLTNGCFDVLHAGHVWCLEQARRQGDILMVAINGDRSVRRLKGPGRPILPARDRLRLLAGLESVDYVTVFTGDTPLRVIEAVTPHVLVKGGDWAGRGVVGHAWVAAHGGRLRIIPYRAGHSSSRLIRRIRAGAGR